MYARLRHGDRPPTCLTPEEKLYALGAAFYDRVAWTPAEGDYYTSSRPDLELYQIVSIRGGVVRTKYCNPEMSGGFAEWPLETFTTEGFGPKRVHVPGWVLGLKTERKR